MMIHKTLKMSSLPLKEIIILNKLSKPPVR